MAKAPFVAGIVTRSRRPASLAASDARRLWGTIGEPRTRSASGAQSGRDARAPQKTVMRQDDARNDHDVMSILDPHQTPLVNHPCVRRVPDLWKELFIR